MSPLPALLAALGLALSAAAAPLELRVMSYNLRFASDQSPHAWPERRPVMQRLLEREAPDLIGTQEGVYRQLQDLAADLPGYAWIGLGREGGSRGEFMAVFYRRDRFEPLAFDHFWLSDTPEVIGSATWGNHFKRMVTWVRFRERSSGRIFEFWNTHFDHEVEAARQKSAALLRARIAATDPALPLVLTGDFNCTAGKSAAYDLLTGPGGLADTWPRAARRTNEDLNSFNDYQAPRSEGDRIDWILTRPPAAVSTAAVVDYAEAGGPPSDHFPVTATLRFD